jgi:HAD superfamily hydrolase (TIGR01450 family)
VRVAVVGLGAMGTRIATRLLEEGYEVVVWNRSPARLRPLIERGAIGATTPAEAAANTDALITMVADPAALRAVSEGDAGIAAGAHATLLIIEMSTVGPAAVARLAATLPDGTALVDAPVLGSVDQAASGALTILIGGTETLVERARPLLEQLGTVVHVGLLGSGAAAKLVANAALFGSVALLGETLALARALGLSETAAHEVLAATPLGAQAKRRRQAIAAGDYPPRFSLALARKDADLIDMAASGAGVELRLVEAARSWLADAEAGGAGGRDYTSVLGRILATAHARQPEAADGGERSIQYDGLIVDLDGVVWVGGEAIEGAVGAVAALRARGTRLVFLTNDPSSSREQQAARLAAIGIPATADDVMTSAAATARFLAGLSDLRRRTAFVIGSPSFQHEIATAGFELVPAAEAERAELVVVGGHSGFDFAELRAATRALASGAQLFGAGRDRTVPAKDGPEPATGAVLAAVETAGGVSATVIGKPEPYMFAIARDMLTGCRRVAVVGDNLASDIAGAKRAGLEAILVLTGTTTETGVARASHQPDLVLPSLATLATAFEAEADSSAIQRER